MFGRMRVSGSHPKLVECALAHPTKYVSQACKTSLLILNNGPDMERLIKEVDWSIHFLPERTLEEQRIASAHRLDTIDLVTMGIKALPYYEWMITLDELRCRNAIEGASYIREYHPTAGRRAERVIFDAYDGPLPECRHHAVRVIAGNSAEKDEALLQLVAWFEPDPRMREAAREGLDRLTEPKAGVSAP